MCIHVVVDPNDLFAVVNSRQGSVSVGKDHDAMRSYR
jgi:hypothetical protein